ncbi:MAG: hypothetical protein ACRDZR_13135, partial [Acidimicrobiales bacterium]
ATLDPPVLDAAAALRRREALQAEVATLEADRSDPREMQTLPRSVVPIAPTSRNAPPASFRPEAVIEGETTRVLVEQVGAVDGNRPGDDLGPPSAEEVTLS